MYYHQCNVCGVGEKLARIIDKTDSIRIYHLSTGAIIKPASTKLESLCEVRDGSTGEIGIGYHTLGAAILSDRKLPYGIYSRIYSSKETDFVSEDNEN